jgi:hypothetical protein
MSSEEVPINQSSGVVRAELDPVVKREERWKALECEPVVMESFTEAPQLPEVVDPDPVKAAHNLTMGMSIRNALMSAGYSQKTANKGMAGIPKKVLKLMGRGARNMLALGKISAEDQEQLVRGRLVYNTIAGSDKGVNSAYRLGQDKRVNMFQPENQTGIVILNAPSAAPTTVESLPEDTE